MKVKVQVFKPSVTKEKKNSWLPIIKDWLIPLKGAGDLSKWVGVS